MILCQFYTCYTYPYIYEFYILYMIIILDLIDDWPGNKVTIFML